MKLVLDTQVLLWWLWDDARLRFPIRSLIADDENQLFASIASPWEISVKYRLSKISESGAVVFDWLDDQGVTLLALKQAHLVALETLPRHHSDPFDHLIIAQALVEDARIVTSDAAMRNYGVDCIRA